MVLTEFESITYGTQDWANPRVRKLMEVYPEVTSSINESW